MPLNPKFHVRLIGAISLLTCALWVSLFRSLAIEDFVSRKWLIPAYVCYFLLTLLALHAFAIYFHLDRKASSGKGLSKRFPKYLDYVVTALLVVGAVQIAFADEWFARHIDHIAGSKPELIEKIRVQAQQHITDQCGKNSFFTPEYCNKLQLIVQSTDLAAFTKAKLFTDTAFLNHTIAMYLAPPGGVIAVKSPIRDYVTRYQAILEYESAKGGLIERGAWAWITLLLLPAVVGFRALKTSTELFFDLS